MRQQGTVPAGLEDAGERKFQGGETQAGGDDQYEQTGQPISLSVQSDAAQSFEEDISSVKNGTTVWMVDCNWV